MGFRRSDLTQEMYEAGPRAEPRAKEHRREVARRSGSTPLEIEADGRNLVAIFVNVGPDSLCVRVRKEVRAGSRVRVRKACEDGAPWHGAEVIHCTETMIGFKLGLKVERGVRAA